MTVTYEGAVHWIQRVESHWVPALSTAEQDGKEGVMPNIVVGRYKDAELQKAWQGWIEPESREWIMFIRADGVPVVYLNRDPKTGAVVD